MTTEFTPGPWIADFENARTNEYGVNEVPISAKGIVDLASVYFKDYEDEKDDEGRANLSLIAAAPELFEALQNLVYTASKLWDEVKPIKDTDAVTVTHPIIEEAKAAIAKATA